MPSTDQTVGPGSQFPALTQEVTAYPRIGILSTGLTAGQTGVVSLAFSAGLTRAVNTGDIIRLDPKTANSEDFTVGASAGIGATAVTVNSQTSVRAHTIGAVATVATICEMQVIVVRLGDGTELSGPNGLLVEMAAKISGEDQTNDVMLTKGPNEWVIAIAAAANTTALAAKAGATGIRHVLKSFLFTVATNTAPGAAAIVTAEVLDGAGILWYFDLAIQNIAGYVYAFGFAGLNLNGTPGNAMSVTYAGAGGAGTYESACASGLDVTN